MSWLPAIVVLAVLAYAVRAALRAGPVAEPGAWDRALEPPVEPGYGPLGLAHIRRDVRQFRAGGICRDGLTMSALEGTTEVPCEQRQFRV